MNKLKKIRIITIFTAVLACTAVFTSCGRSGSAGDSDTAASSSDSAGSVESSSEDVIGGTLDDTGDTSESTGKTENKKYKVRNDISDSEKKKTAKDSIGMSADDLMKKIGAPEESSVSPSCETEGEDAVYDYGSFTVYAQSEKKGGELKVYKVK